MRMKVIGVLCFVFLCSATAAFAAPVNLPEGLKGKEGLLLAKDWSENVDLSVSYFYDNVFKRELAKNAGKVDFNTMGGKITLSLLNKFDIYAMLGELMSPEWKDILGLDVKSSLQDKFMWGVGANAIIYEWEQQGIAIFGDGNYRRATGIDYDSVTVNGITYSKSQLTGTSASARWEEWQFALGVSKKFKYFIPYAGVKYSDVRAAAKVTASGTTYDLGTASSKSKVGPFVGVSIIPTKGVSIDVCGRFVDEQAISVGATVRF